MRSIQRILRTCTTARSSYCLEGYIFLHLANAAQISKTSTIVSSVDKVVEIGLQNDRVVCDLLETPLRKFLKGQTVV